MKTKSPVVSRGKKISEKQTIETANKKQNARQQTRNIMRVSTLFVTSTSVARSEPAHGTQHSNCCEPTETLCFSAQQNH